MAHFAKLDANNIVVDVLVVNNEDCQDDDGNEDEAVGVAFLQNLLGSDTSWKQTSYNANMRVRYASIGGSYDSTRDAFIDEKPFASWSLNTATLEWEPPVAYPTDGSIYRWNETNQQWDAIELEE